MIASISAIIQELRAESLALKGFTNRGLFLYDRCAEFERPLSNFDTFQLKLQKFQTSLEYLRACLTEILLFMKVYCSSTWMQYATNAEGYKLISDKIEDFYSNLYQASSDLNFNVVHKDTITMNSYRTAIALDDEQIIQYVTSLLDNNGVLTTIVRITLQTTSMSVPERLTHIEMEVPNFSSIRNRTIQVAEIQNNLNQNNLSQIDLISVLPSLTIENLSIIRSVDPSLLSCNMSRNKLGEGRYGSVYSCRYDSIKYALKHFKYTIADTPESVLKVNSECFMLQLLSHPFINRVVGLDIERGYMITDIAHSSLFDIIHKNRSLPQGFNLDSELKLKWSFGIACGLKYLHFHNILHRDLKPSNVLLAVNHNYELIAKISDYHIHSFMSPPPAMRRMNGSSGSGGSGGNTVNFVSYYAPEILENITTESYQRTKQHDIFAYGVTVNELFSGTMPWKGLWDHQIIRSVCEKSKRAKSFVPANEKEEKLFQIIGGLAIIIIRGRIRILTLIIRII